MRIFVTGATGFIGSALCAALCRDGHQVAAFHRPTSYLGNIAGLSIFRYIGDLTDAASVDQAVSDFRPEVIFHLGAQMTAAPTVNRIMQVNVLGTRYVLQSALHYGVGRVVLMSSATTLGLPEPFRNRDRQPGILNESHMQSADSGFQPFARSKYLAEMEIQSASTGGLDAVIVNPFMVVGPGDWYRRKSSLLMQLKRSHPVVMVRGGFNVISVDDVVLGLRNACSYGKSGERYILCGENLTYEQFCTLCGAVGGFEGPKLLYENSLISNIIVKLGIGRNLDIECLEGNIFRYPNRYFYYSPRKSRVELHLPPAENIRETLEKTYQWFEENS